ncbi:hypothetical protein D9M68_528070 [compost metagenome]
MNGGFTLEPFNGPFQRGNAPIIHLVEEHVERGLVKLDDIDAGSLQFLGFLVENLGELPSQLFAALVVGVVQRVDHRHRARQSPFDRLLGLLAQELCVFDKYRLAASHGAHDRRHARVVAVADPDGLAVLEINAFQMLDKRRHEVLTRLFAVADDIDTCVLLFLQR